MHKCTPAIDTHLGHGYKAVLTWMANLLPNISLQGASRTPPVAQLQGEITGSFGAESVTAGTTSPSAPCFSLWLWKMPHLRSLKSLKARVICHSEGQGRALRSVGAGTRGGHAAHQQCLEPMVRLQATPWHCLGGWPPVPKSTPRSSACLH